MRPHLHVTFHSQYPKLTSLTIQPPQGVASEEASENLLTQILDVNNNWQVQYQRC